MPCVSANVAASTSVRLLPMLPRTERSSSGTYAPSSYCWSGVGVGVGEGGGEWGVVNMCVCV